MTRDTASTAFTRKQPKRYRCVTRHRVVDGGHGRYPRLRTLQHRSPVPDCFSLRLTRCLLTLALAAPVVAHAQISEALPDASADAERVPEVAALRTDTPIRLDGQLDDAAWQEAAFAGGFIQRDPVEGSPTDAPTEIAFLYDGAYLYVGARMTYDDDSAPPPALTRRDNAGDAERILVSLDSYLDRRTAYTFGVTNAGVRLDYYHPDDTQHQRDFSFDPVWEARSATHEGGWTAEMRIPFSQLRFTGGSSTWGLNINRYVPNTNEDSYWVVVPRDEPGWSSRFGVLTGLDGLRPTRRLEVLPYVATGTTRFGEVDEDDPFASTWGTDVRVGGDLKVGIGSNLTLDATVNPDFGQVEGDPAEVNLSTRETFFPERRPFFTEGSQLLNGGGAGYFYSRRIGAAPGGEADADYVDYPGATTILGAAKLTGRLPGGLSLGALAAVTGEAHAKTFDLSSELEDRIRVAPRTGYAVARLQQEVGTGLSEGSVIGVMLTGVQRDVESGTALGDVLPQRAVSGALDGTWRIAENSYYVVASGGFSHVSGSEEAILARQTSSVRFFQRPDQSHVSVDSNRTALTGYTGSFRAGKNSGRLLGQVRISFESPGFDLNDIGRLGGSDGIDTFGRITYRQTEPGPTFRSWSVSAFNFNSWNTGGVHTGSDVTGRVAVTFDNFWQIEARAGYQPPSYDDRATRGGPLVGKPQSWDATLEVETDRSRSWRVEVDGRLSGDELGGWGVNAGVEVALRPSPRLQLAVEPSIRRGRSALQYRTTEDGGRPNTFGQRYIFAPLERTTLSAQVRATYIVSPDLSLEIYAEPFVASGQYDAPGQLSAPRSTDLLTFGEDIGTLEQEEDGTYVASEGGDVVAELSPGFNVRSFRSNVVMRWEWRRGSTLFVVWQQDRGGDLDPLERARPGDLVGAFGETGDNVFALKLNYWLPV